MSTVADLKGEIALDPNPFISATRSAGGVWTSVTDNMIAQGQKMARVLDNVFIDAAGKWRNSLGQFTLDPIEKAFKTLGVTSQASLNKTAQDAVSAFNIIKNSGTSTAHDVQNAYTSMQKAIAAANQEIAKPATGGFLSELGPKIKAAAGEMQIFGGIVAGVFGGAIAFATKAASDLSESMNAAEAVFKESVGTVKEFASTSATSFGISRQAALEATASFGGMFTAMGLGRKASADLSVGVIALAADLVSLRNIQGGLAEGLEKVRSGLIGESEPLRRIGILVDDATIKHKAFEVGLKNAGGELSQAQKVLLRYLEILDQSKDAMGDFQKTSTGMANSSRILAAQFEDLAAKLGERFATAGNTAFGIAVQLMGVMNNLPTSIMGAAAAFLAAGAAVGAATLAIGTIVAILGGPLTLALTGVVAIAGAMAIGISQNWDAIVEMTQGMGVSVSGSLRAIVVAAGYLVDVISAVARQVIQAFDIIINGAKIMANAVIATFKSLASSLGNILTALASGNMVEFAVAMSTAFSGAVKSAFDATSGDMKGLLDRFHKNSVATMSFIGGQNAKAFGAAFDKGLAQAKAFDYGKLRQQILDQLKQLTGDIDKEGKKGGKAAANAASKAAMDSVNEMLETLKAGVKINKSYWDRMADDEKAALTAKSILIRKFNDELKDILLDRVLKEKTTIEVSLAQWKRLSDGIVEQLNKAGVAVKLVFPKILQSVDEVTDAVAKDYVKALQDADFATKKIFDSIEDEAIRFPKPFLDAFGILHDKFFNTFKDALEDIKNKTRNALGDGIGGILIGLGETFKLNQQTIAKWAGNVGTLVDTIPGHFGDMVRGVMSTINQWAEFGNSVLKILHDLNNNIPGTIGDLFTKLKGAFSTGFASLLGVAAQGIASIASIFTGGSIIGGAQGGGKGFLQGALGGGILGVGANMSLMSILGLAGIGTGPLGWAIMGGGALIGGLIGLFKKKSPEQVKAEQEAKKIGELNMQSVINSVNQGVIETMQKGAQLLEQISGFTDLPRKQIRRFVNQLTLIMTEFVDAMKDFKLESAQHAKDISENLGAGFELMMGGAQLIEAIRAVGELSDEKIKQFIDTTISIIDKWLEAVSTIELHAAKFAGKISEKLKPSIEVMGMIPDLIKSMIDASTLELSDEQIAVPFDIAKRIIDKFFELADQFKEYALKKTVKTAEQFKSLFESTRSIFEAMAIIGQYKPLEASIFDGINGDMDRVTSWLDQAFEKVVIWRTKTEDLRNAILAFAAEMTGIGGALSGAFSGSSGQNLTLQPAAASSAFSAPSTGGLSAAGSQQTVLNINILGDVHNEGQFLDKIAQGLQALQRQRRLKVQLV